MAAKSKKTKKKAPGKGRATARSKTAAKSASGGKKTAKTKSGSAAKKSKATAKTKKSPSSRATKGKQAASKKPAAKKASSSRSKAAAGRTKASSSRKTAAKKTTKKTTAKKSTAKRGGTAKKSTAKDRLKLQKERAKAAQQKAREKAQKEKERQKALKEKERQQALKEKERQKALKEKEKERAAALKAKEQAKEKARKEREAAALAGKRAREEEKARVSREREAEKERLKAERQAEKERLKAERAADRERLKRERQEEKERLKREREAERERIRKERDAERERIRLEREAAREAYRKAKEAEQSRLRADKEAAKKALEGRIARQSAKLRSSGSRIATTSRVYSPNSIPDQSGTRVGGASPSTNKFANLRTLPPPPPEEAQRVFRAPTVPPPPPEARPQTFEERYRAVELRLAKADAEFRAAYDQNYVMSWIHHDSALEGVVYTYEELKTGINPDVVVVPDSSLQSVCDNIRRHKAAIELVRELGEKKRQPVTIEMFRRIYLTLHPDGGDLKAVKYRKDVPQHRLYFHEYAPPDKIAPKVKAVFDWLNSPEPKKLKTTMAVAGKVHFDLLRIFPFDKDSGKVVRLFMNLLLLRSELPPAIVHLTERQRYYEALKSSQPTLVDMLTEAIDNSLLSMEKQLDARENKTHALV